MPQGGRKEKKMEIKISAYETYKNRIEVDTDTVIVSLWNAYIEAEGRDNKIYVNDVDFFDSTFDNKYDAAWAVSVSGKWHWSDDFVYFGEDGYLTSFNHWDDKNSPIDIDKIDVTDLVKSLENKNKKDRYVVNDIPRAIHDALKE